MIDAMVLCYHHVSFGFYLFCVVLRYGVCVLYLKIQIKQGFVLTNSTNFIQT